MHNHETMINTILNNPTRKKKWGNKDSSEQYMPRIVACFIHA